MSSTIQKKQNFYDRFPPYVPFHFKQLACVRKLYRQTMVRIWENDARRNGCPAILADGPGQWTDLKGGLLTLSDQNVNRSALNMDEDLNQPNIQAVTAQLEAVKEKMSRQGLSFCSAAGTFVKNTYTPFNERKKLWEDTWVLAHSDIRPGLRVLDIGGASTPFSFYLADLGCSVVVIDNDWGCCGTVYNANHVAKKMSWDLKALDRDIEKGFPYPDNHFDRVFSICVIEHLSSTTRRFMMKEIHRVLKPGGIAGLTTDYDHGRKELTTDKGLRFGYPEKFRKDVLEPAGMNLMGNSELIDAKPEENFLGAFFFRKERKD